MGIHVLSDDEEESNGPSSVPSLDSTVKTYVPDLGVQTKPLLGLTQLFVPTMPDTQMEQLDPEGATTSQQGKGSLDFLRQAPVASLPAIEQVIDDQTEDGFQDTQPLQSQSDLLQGPDRWVSPTQVSDFPDPTQDVGFSKIWSPVRMVQSPPSTIATVLVGRSQDSVAEDKPAVKKRGRLQRRIKAQAVPEDTEEGSDARNADDVQESNGPSDAFDVMLRPSKKAIEDEGFDKKKSRAKDLVEEWAEESEDEYAGLGGASDDGGSDDEEDEDMSDLLDDEAQNIDEQDLAAFMA